MRVLIIDDEEMVRFTLREMLESRGHQVDEAANGLAGIALLRGRAYDLVITDMLMPQMAGPETILEIRKARPQAKIIAISGGDRHGDQNTLDQGRKLGVDGALQKPFSDDELLGMVDRLFGVHP